MTTEASAFAAALFNFICAASCAVVACASLLYFLILVSVTRFRGVVNDAAGELRSNFEDH